MSDNYDWGPAGPPPVKHTNFFTRLGDWLTDTLASSDIIDLYFNLSDLKNVHLSPAEMAEISEHDARSRVSGILGGMRGGSNEVRQIGKHTIEFDHSGCVSRADGIPIGKIVGG